MRRSIWMLIVVCVAGMPWACAGEPDAPLVRDGDHAWTGTAVPGAEGTAMQGASLSALPGVREVGHFELDVRTGTMRVSPVADGWKSGSQALPGMEADHSQNRNPDDGPVAETFRLVQDAGGNGATEAACEVFWTDGWADTGWRFWLPEAARPSFLDDLHMGGPGPGGGGDGNRFCTNFDLTNDYTRVLRNVWVVVDGFSIPGVRGFVDWAPRTWPSEVDGEPDLILDPFSEQGLFRYGDVNPGETVKFQWYFHFGGAEVRDFSIRGRLVEILDEQCGSGEDDNGDGLADSGCGLFGAGAACLGHADCATGQCAGGSVLEGTLGVCTSSGLGEPCGSDGDCTGGLVCASTGPDSAMCWDEHFCSPGHHVLDFQDPDTFSCAAIDHCVDGTDTCGPGAICRYRGPGRYFCDCPGLSIPTGFDCVDRPLDEGRVKLLSPNVQTPSNEVTLVLMEPGNLIYNWHFLGSPLGWTTSGNQCGGIPCSGFEADWPWIGRHRTSYLESWKEQTVDLTAAGFGPDQLDGAGRQPIVVREYAVRTIEWVSTRYRLLSYLEAPGGTALASSTTMLDNTDQANYPWEAGLNAVEHRYDSYPDGVRQVRLRTTGVDLGFWGGYYGPISMWPVVRIGDVDMRFSDDLGTTWSAWQPFQSRFTYTFPEPEGLQTVLVQMRDWTGEIFEHQLDVVVAPDLY